MTAPQPFQTARLFIRPFTDADAPALVPLAGAFEVHDMTLRIPHPYALSDAESWLARLRETYVAGTDFPLAVTLLSTQELVGAIGLEVNKDQGRAELGYWIGVPHWGKGYATEAGRAMLAFGFETLKLHRITAHHFARNPASGRVLAKIGMQREGLLRQHVRKHGGFEDCVMYGILRADVDHAGIRRSERI